MNLSDSEKRDICRLIEEGKNLPERYRFLLFEESKQVELKWNGKNDEVSKVVLPFQIIEQIDEPRTEDLKYDQGVLNLIQGRQKKSWTNKLIWGDNKYILSTLKNGPMRKEIDNVGGVKLVYIDPPFDTSANFSVNIKVGDSEDYDKQPSVLEEIAYRDTWGKGKDSFISMLYERLQLISGLLTDDGIIVLHIGKKNAYLIRNILDEIFGPENFIDEITWQRSHAHGDTGQGSRHFGRVTETIFMYSKTNNYCWNPQYNEYSQEIIKRDYRYIDDKGERYRLTPVDGPGGASKGNPFYEFLGVKGYWRYSKEKMQKFYDDGEIILSKTGKTLNRKKYLKDAKGTPITDLWNDVGRIAPSSNENLDYPTQKPERLLRRIIQTFSNPGDLICDFFGGSGTTAAVAEKLCRKWISTDLGKFAIHTTKKRLISVQRELKNEGKNWSAFEILNLGKYQREYFLSNDDQFLDEISIKDKKLKIYEFENLIFEAYKAERVSGFKTLHGKRGDDFISLGPVNQPLSRNHIEEVISECIRNKILSVHILGFEYEMGLFPTIQEEAKEKGLRLLFKHIPIDIFDKRAIDKGEVFFHDVAFIEFKCNVNSGNIIVELKDFAVFYNEEYFSSNQELRPGKSKVVIEQGQILEKGKKKNGDYYERIITKNWFDWIDYWSVDFNYESKKEFINFYDVNGKFQEKWTGNYVFENEWQSFRTKASNNKLELKSSEKRLSLKSTKVAVKVVDIFGNDTMQVLEVVL